MSTNNAARVLDHNFELETPGGTTLRGSLEHFPQSRTVVVFGDDGLTTTPLTVSATESKERPAPLNADEVLLRNWTDLRGVPQELAKKGLIELTGEAVHIGQFRLEALVARVR